MNAKLNLTWYGQNGDLPDFVDYDGHDDVLKAIAKEAVETGGVPGVTVNGMVDLDNFVVDRFPATEDLPARVFIRPKVPFGGSARNLV